MAQKKIKEAIGESLQHNAIDVFMYLLISRKTRVTLRMDKGKRERKPCDFLTFPHIFQ